MKTLEALKPALKSSAAWTALLTLSFFLFNRIFYFQPIAGNWLRFIIHNYDKATFLNYSEYEEINS